MGHPRTVKVTVDGWQKFMQSIILRLSMETLRSLRTVDGVSLAYRLTRHATTPRRLVVLMHGVASNMTRWSEFAEHSLLKQDWDVLRLDLRGHGESFVRGRLNLDIWCRDLRDVLDAEGYEQALLIGHSLGAQVAFQFAVRYPTRLLGLVLIDPIFHQALRGSLRLLNKLRHVVKLTAAVILLLNSLGLRRRLVPRRDLRALDDKTRETLLAAGQQEKMISLYSSPWEDLKFFPVASYLQEVIEITRRLPAPAQINAPMLVLLSSGITYTDPVVTRGILAEHPRAQVVTIEAHHWPLTEKPQEVRAAIEEWCRRLP